MTVSELVNVLQNAKIDCFMVQSIEKDGVIYRDKDGAEIRSFKYLEQEYGNYIVKQIDILKEPREDKLLLLELKE